VKEVCLSQYFDGAHFLDTLEYFMIFESKMVYNTLFRKLYVVF